MGSLAQYIGEMRHIRRSGEATDETSYYAALANLLNAVGETLQPKVHCVLTPKNRGAGIPDGALFLKNRARAADVDESAESRAPERGVVEVKGPGRELRRIAKSTQVKRYLDRYGQVLVTNYREFALFRRQPDGTTAPGESFELASTEEAFWALDPVEIAAEDEAAFDDFLQRALLADAPLSSPEDLAWFLAAYARVARERIDNAGELPKLATIRRALEDALGIKFEGDEGRNFFHSALVQTLFYGVFAAWVSWSEVTPASPAARFSWRTAEWTLNVPMVRVLFDQLAAPWNLPAGLDEVLDWTEDVFARVEREPFFARFEKRDAVQYFYEPFLKAYDPDLRVQLGVWYTPPEIVRYMVARVHEALQRDLGVELGLADERVHILDPCTGTGSFLVETLRTIADVLDEHHGDALVAEQVKGAAMERVHGFELLPAPFVVTHLQIGLLLSELGAPLDLPAAERPSVYLTNSLTGWQEEDEPILPFEEFRSERAAAGSVKRAAPILVVLGNPPYNAFAGVSEEDGAALVEAYKEGLSDPPWSITRNTLNDYYVRFFRIAERRIAEQTGQGVVCFISNFGWLGVPSAVVMRKRLLGAFDNVYIDNLNGDSRETGKRTPDGRPDPSAFSTTLNPPGIRVGTAVSLLVRTDPRQTSGPQVLYREFWGADKREQLVASLAAAQDEPEYERLSPAESNWYRLRTWAPRRGYERWPSIPDLAAESPKLGMNENRDGGLIDIDRQRLVDRMTHFLDAAVAFNELDQTKVEALVQPWARYDAQRTRDRLVKAGGYDGEKVVRFQSKPFDVRHAYVETRAKLWNEARAEYVKSQQLGSEFLLARNRAARALDGVPLFLSPHLTDQHALHTDAYAVPLLLASTGTENGERLFPLDDATDHAPWRPNLSDRALGYLADLGYDDATTSRATARMLWLHTIAIGFAPLYLEENGDALSAGWPRIPLPESAEDLEYSARLGARIGALLDIDTPLPGLDTSAPPHLAPIGRIERVDERPPQGRDLHVTAGWGIQQVRRQPRSGAISHLVMPAAGRVERRARSEEELTPLATRDIALLGDEVLDIYLNPDVRWRGVPEAAWNFTIGGFQVLRKWLSYREESILGRGLTLPEAREFTSIVRRLTELTRLRPDLDYNYRVASGAVEQDPLFETLA
jgi:hypothetical protein